MPSALVLVCSIIAGFLVVYVVLKIFSSSRDTRWQVIRKNGNKIDPIYFFYNDLSPQQFDELLKRAQASNQSFD